MNLPEEQRKELANLSYFKDIRERRAWIARMTVLLAVLGLLILNIFLMYLSASAVILNIDLSRLEQSDQFDLVERRLEYLDRQIKVTNALCADETPSAPAEAASNK